MWSVFKLRRGLSHASSFSSSSLLLSCFFVLWCVEANDLLFLSSLVLHSIVNDTLAASVVKSWVRLQQRSHLLSARPTPLSLIVPLNGTPYSNRSHLLVPVHPSLSVLNNAMPVLVNHLLKCFAPSVLTCGLLRSVVAVSIPSWPPNLACCIHSVACHRHGTQSLLKVTADSNTQNFFLFFYF